VTPTEDIEVKVSNFFSKIREPLLADVKIDASGDVTLSRQYPTDLPDLFKGEQLIVAGRFKDSGRGTITLTGKVNGEKKTFSEKFEFPKKSSEHEFIPRLWATRRVGALLDQIRLNGESAELRDEVTELARKYGIVTPYTAYLIVEDEAKRGIPQEAQNVPSIRLREQRVELEQLYRRLGAEKSGEQAVLAATENRSLQDAGNLNYAAKSRADRYSAGGLAGQMPALASPAPNGPVMLGRSATLKSEPGAADAVQQQANRFAGGRNFVLNNNQWVDSQLQAQTNATKVRVQFNSAEYFKLAANKELTDVLALGSNVQFVYRNQVFEIHE
jgi:Ca-activated chloride channel homolog